MKPIDEIIVDLEKKFERVNKLSIECKIIRNDMQETLKQVKKLKQNCKETGKKINEIIRSKSGKQE